MTRWCNRGSVKTYSAFVKEAQRFRNQGSRAEVDLLYLLVEMEPLTVIWQSKHPTWEAVLADLMVVSWTRYHHFRKAHRLFTKQEVQRIGVSATLVLAEGKQALFPEIKREALAWVAKHSVPMRSRDAHQLLARLDPANVKVTPKLDVDQWKQRAQLLEAVLHQQGIEVPHVQREVNADMTGVVDASVAFVRAQFKLRQMFPSCSDQDLAKIAMQQVETASISLKQVLGIGLGKGRSQVQVPGAPGMSTTYVSDQVIDQQIQDAIVKSPGFITSKMILDKLDYPEQHRTRVRQRIVERLEGTPRLHALGKVGPAKAFALVEVTR